MWYAGTRQSKERSHRSEVSHEVEEAETDCCADAQVEIALPVAGVLNDVRSAFFGLCVNAGKAVLSAMMEEERGALCGPKGVANPTRSAYRGGHTRSQVRLAGQRIGIARPRARTSRPEK